MIENRHLRYFIEVARTLHMTRAAEQLHIAQPALSQNIQQLEEELGIDGILFELNFGAAIPAEMMMRSLQLLCEEVMPHFK